MVKNIIDNVKNQIYAYLRIVAETFSGRDIGTNRIQTMNNPVSKQIVSNNDSQIEPEMNNEISISRGTQDEIEAKTMGELNVPTHDAEQSSSKSLSSDYREECSSNNPKCSTYEPLDANKLLTNDTNQQLRKKMIAIMSKHVNFEEKYLDLFKSFVAFQEGYITKEHLISNFFQIETPSPKSKQPFMTTKSIGKGRNLCSRDNSATVHPVARHDRKDQNIRRVFFEE